MPIKPGCKGLSKAQCGFGKGLTNMVGTLIDVKNVKVKRYATKYRRR